MNKANPVEMRKCAEMAQLLVNAGIRFVPIPAADEADFQRMLSQLDSRIEQIIDESEKGDKQC